MTEPLLYEKTAGVAYLRLNRPEVLNALDAPLVNALIEAVEDANRDPTVRCLALLGAGRAFCAGGDLKAMQQMDKEAFRDYILLIQRLSAAFRALSKPSIVAVQGYALAGGFELALLCDIRIAADTAEFGLPDTRIGLSPTSGMTYLLPRIVGLGWAKHLTLTGKNIDALQAARIGLVTRVVMASELEQTAQEMARSIAACPPVGLRYVKQGFDLAVQTDFHTVLALETDAEVACFDTEEVRENLQTFMNRKKEPGTGS